MPVTNLTGSNAGPNVDTIPELIGLSIGNVAKVGVFSLTLAPVAVPTITNTEQTFAVPGLQLGDFVSTAYSAGAVGIVNSRVSAVNVLAVTFTNPTAGSVTPPTGVYTLFVGRVNPNEATDIPGWSSY